MVAKKLPPPVWLLHKIRSSTAWEEGKARVDRRREAVRDTSGICPNRIVAEVVERSVMEAADAQGNTGDKSALAEQMNDSVIGW